jgi:hypothetical protein
MMLSETENLQSPQEKLVDTTELLEHILSFLPTKGLIACRKLSKRVKGVIDGSLVLREKMLLRPTRAAREAWRLDPEIDGSGKGITSVRPVAGMVPLPGRNIGHLQTHYATPHATRTPAILNPIFGYKTERMPDLYDSRDECDSASTGDTIHHIGKLHLDRQSSILDMYLTQPPCRQAWVILRFSVPSNRSEVSHLLCKGLLELDGGITIRDLFKAAFTLRGVVYVNRMVPKPPRKKKRRTWTSWEPRKYKKPEPRKLLEPELFHNATLIEILRSLDIEEVLNVDDVQASVSCWFSDTIIATDEMWAGVAPIRGGCQLVIGAT